MTVPAAELVTTAGTGQHLVPADQAQARLRPGQPGHGRAGALRDHQPAGPAQPGHAAPGLRPGELAPDDRRRRRSGRLSPPDEGPGWSSSASGVSFRFDRSHGGAVPWPRPGGGREDDGTRSMTTRDEAPPHGRDRPGRHSDDDARPGLSAGCEPAGATAGGARAQGRRPVPGRAGHQDPGSLPRRPRAW